MTDLMEAICDHGDHSVADWLEETQSDGDDGYYVEEVNDDEILADLVGDIEEAQSEEERKTDINSDVEEYEVVIPANEKSDKFPGNLTWKRGGSEGQGTKRRRSSASQAGNPKKLKSEGYDDGAKRSLRASSLKTNPDQSVAMKKARNTAYRKTMLA